MCPHLNLVVSTVVSHILDDISGKCYGCDENERDERKFAMPRYPGESRK